MLQKLTSFTKTVAGLPDVPSPAMSALQLKQWFDTAPEEMRVSFNALIDSLLSTTADSGAKNIGVEPITDVTGNNIQAVLQDLKLQLNGAIAGSIPPGSITEDMLAFTVSTTAAGVSLADTGNHFTATNVEGALDELFQSASSVKTNVANAIGAPATSSDTGTTLAGHITTQKGRLAAEIGDGNNTSTLQYLADRLIVRSDAIATAVNGKGVAASSADTLAQLATKVGQIVTGRAAQSGTATSVANGTGGNHKITVSGLGFQPQIVLMWAHPFGGQVAGFQNKIAVIAKDTNFLTGAYRNHFARWSSSVMAFTSSTAQGTADDFFQVTATGFTGIVASSDTTMTTQNINWLAIG